MSKFKVGQRWIQRDGKIVVITDVDNHGIWLSEDDHRYGDGNYYDDTELTTPYDLLTLYPDALTALDAGDPITAKTPVATTGGSMEPKVFQVGQQWTMYGINNAVATITAIESGTYPIRIHYSDNSGHAGRTASGKIFNHDDANNHTGDLDQLLPSTEQTGGFTQPCGGFNMKLKVGGKYRSRSGEIIRITEHFPQWEHPFVASNGNRYNEIGLRMYCDEARAETLVEEIVETPIQTPFEVGKSYGTRANLDERWTVVSVTAPGPQPVVAVRAHSKVHTSAHVFNSNGQYYSAEPCDGDLVLDPPRPTVAVGQCYQRSGIMWRVVDIDAAHVFPVLCVCDADGKTDRFSDNMSRCALVTK